MKPILIRNIPLAGFFFFFLFFQSGPLIPAPGCGERSSPQEAERKDQIFISGQKGNTRYLVTLPQQARRDVHLRLLDMLGRQVRDTVYRELEFPGEVQVDASQLREGLYLLRVTYKSFDWSARLVHRFPE